MNQGLVVDQMQRAEIQTLRDWAVAEGWNPGIHDLDLVYGIEPEAFLALRKDGRLIGGATIITHGGAFGFVGLFIVHPDFRSQGLGTTLWKTLNETLQRRLEPHAPMGLDGVMAMVPYYGREGYVLQYRHIRYQGTLTGHRHRSVVDLSTLPFDQILAYDAQHYPANRSAFLNAWINQPGGVAVGIPREGKLLGMGVARPAERGYKIGPLFAENPEVAADILAALAEGVQGDPLQIDVPENNPDALAWVQQVGFEPVFDCGRMYRGSVPELPHQSIFGTTTLEFG